MPGDQAAGCCGSCIPSVDFSLQRGGGPWWISEKPLITKESPSSVLLMAPSDAAISMLLAVSS